MPTPGVSAPACWIRSAGVLIDLSTLVANGDGRSAVSLNGCHELDAAVPVPMAASPAEYARGKTARSDRDSQSPHPLESRAPIPSDQTAVRLSENPAAQPGQESVQDQCAGGIDESVPCSAPVADNSMSRKWDAQSPRFRLKCQSDEVENEPTEPSRDSLRVKPEQNADLSSSDSPQTPVGQRFLRAAQR
jgi:hypothetical protein